MQHRGEWAYLPFSRLSEEGLVSISVAGEPVLFVYSEGVSSPPGRTIVGAGRDVGSAQVYLALHEGGELSFFPQG